MSVHLAVPFQMEGDHAATVEEGSIEEITQNVAVIVGTLRGQRLVVPEFGVGDPTFELGAASSDPADLETAAARWEPRAVLTIDRSMSATGEEDLVVSVALQEGR